MIPKLIHKIIITDDGKIPEFNEELTQAIETWYHLNPKYEVVWYSGEDIEQYIQEYFDARTLAAYKKVKPYAFKCDFARQLILYKEGGWYSDLRQVCLHALPSSHDYYCVVDCPPNQLCMYNALIGTVPGHPITKKYIDTMIFNIEHDHYGLDCLYVTGPGVYMQSAIDYVRTHPADCGVGVHTSDEYIEFGKVKFVKCKYNDARGADNRDIPGTNDYGEMWRRGRVY